MFRFEYNGKTYRVRFRHNQEHQGVVLRLTKGKAVPYHGYTAAIVDILGEDGKWTTIFESLGYRSALDKNFDRRLGREAALHRFVKQYPDTEKGFRKALFGAVYDA